MPHLRATLGAGDVARAIEAECDRVGILAGPMCETMTRDVASLALIFAGIISSPKLRLRLQPVSANSCRRFHVDRIRARLLCTYRGSGTQFAREPEGAPMLQMAAGEVAILRGTLWPEDEIPAVLHRSPPIEGSGEVRLLLVIDPVLDDDDQEDLQ